MRYRVTTREILHRSFFNDSDPNAATKVTSRLVDGGFLARYPLVGTSSYFTLGIKGTKVFGIPARHAKPLGVQSLYIQMGILGYCFGSTGKRKRLRVAEIQKQHPGLLQKGLESSQYVIDSSTQPGRLSFVRVDGGGSTDHVIRKLRSDVEARQGNSLCQALMQMDRFFIACVTYTEAKGEEIAKRIAPDEWPCPVVVEVIPTLLELQASFRDS